MTDTMSKEQRSKIMSKIHSTNTRPETILKQSLKGMRFRYQPKIYGKPDFGIRKNKIAVFVDGCFWHKCPRCFRKPKSNLKYWERKIDSNVNRDQKVTQHLKQEGWTVIRIWEHEVRENADGIAEGIREALSKKN